VKLDPSEGGEWSRWLQAFVKDTGKELSEDARPLLLEWTGSSLTELKSLVDRAALFAGGNSEIRREHVSAVGYRATPEDVFRLSGAILVGDRASVLALMETLVRQGEEPLALIGLIARQYRWLLGILALRAEGKPDAAIATECGIYPMAAKVLFPASRRLGGKGVIRGLVALADADHSLKSSRLPREHVLTKLALTLRREVFRAMRPFGIVPRAAAFARTEAASRTASVAPFAFARMLSIALWEIVFTFARAAVLRALRRWF
jgi:DNA polymerase-3 subunit delta